MSVSEHWSVLSARHHHLCVLSVLCCLRAFGSVQAEERWIPVGPFDGGTVSAIHVVEGQTSTVWIGVFSQLKWQSPSAIYRSSSKGETWTPIMVPRDWNWFEISAICTDAASPSKVYAATRGGGVLGSSDGGKSWPHASLAGKDVRTLVLVPGSPFNTLYAGTWGTGVFRSTDGGSSWEPVNNGLDTPEILFLMIDSANQSTIYAGTRSGVWRSNNEGDSWKSVSRGLPDQGISCFAVGPADSSILYAGGLKGSLFRSNDKGENWQDISISLTDSTVMSITVERSDPQTVYAGTRGGGVFRSRDAGNTWTAANSGLSHWEVEVLVSDADHPSTIYAGFRDGGMYRSADGGEHWEEVNHGLSAVGMGPLAINPFDPFVIYAGSETGLYRSTDQGMTWEEIDSGLTHPDVSVLKIDPVHPANIYAGTWGGGMFRSSNGGDTWTEINSGITNKLVQSAAIDPSNPSKVYVATRGGMFQSTDYGESWKAINNGLPANLRAVKIHPLDHSTLFAGVWGNGVYKSTDGGKSWKASSAGSTFFKYARVVSFTFDPVDPAILYAATWGDGMYRTQDGGESWGQLPLPSQERRYAVVAISPVVPSNLYTNPWREGVLGSSNRGDTWKDFNVGMSVGSVSTLQFDPVIPFLLWATTYGGGVLRIELESARHYYAQFGNGANQLFSQVILFNGDETTQASALIRLRDSDGQPLSVTINGDFKKGDFNAEVPASGLRVFRTDGNGPASVGSATVYSDRPLEGVILFGGEIGVAGVGTSTPLENGFLAPVEASVVDGINTGIAMVNLNQESVAIDLELCDRDGQSLSEARVTLDGLGHLAAFANEFEWNQDVDLADFQGLLKASAPPGLAATVIQTRPGELATMPVASRLPDVGEIYSRAQPGLPQEDNQENELYFPQFGDGEGQLFSQILLINRDETHEAQTTLSLLNDDGLPLEVDLNEQWVSGTTDIIVPAGGMVVLQTDGKGDLTTGSATVTSDRPLAGVVLFGGITGVAGVGASQALSRGFLAPMERSNSSRINTGIAIMNLEAYEVALDLTLMNEEGAPLTEAQVMLPEKGHLARFPNQILWNDSVDLSSFQGLLKVHSSGRIAATVIQTRPGRLATMPVAAR